MTVEKHTYHRIYELFSVNEPIADWIAMTDFDTPYPLMLTLMEAKENEEREAPLEAVIWAAAEIAAAANLRDYRNIPSVCAGASVPCIALIRSPNWRWRGLREFHCGMCISLCRGAEVCL